MSIIGGGPDRFGQISHTWRPLDSSAPGLDKPRSLGSEDVSRLAAGFSADVATLTAPLSSPPPATVPSSDDPR